MSELRLPVLERTCLRGGRGMTFDEDFVLQDLSEASSCFLSSLLSCLSSVFFKSLDDLILFSPVPKNIHNLLNYSIS